MTEQAEYWNGQGGERWVANQTKLDSTLAAITQHWLGWVAPKPGERALDVGCGTGTTALMLAEAGCVVTGVDVSKPMLALAQQRAPHLIFVEADAQRAPLPAADLVTSRFGVMFFDDPVAAFRNLKSTGGRLAFVCWQAFAENEWATAPLAVAKPLLPAEPPPDPHAPGPFAFGNRPRLESILAAAGWRDIEIAGRESTMPMGATVDEAVKHASTFGPMSRSLAAADDATRAKVAAALRPVFERTMTPKAAVWLVRAAQ